MRPPTKSGLAAFFCQLSQLERLDRLQELNVFCVKFSVSSVSDLIGCPSYNILVGNVLRDCALLIRVFRSRCCTEIVEPAFSHGVNRELLAVVLELLFLRHFLDT